MLSYWYKPWVSEVSIRRENQKTSSNPPPKELSITEHVIGLIWEGGHWTFHFPPPPLISFSLDLALLFPLSFCPNQGVSQSCPKTILRIRTWDLWTKIPATYHYAKKGNEQFRSKNNNNKEGKSVYFPFAPFGASRQLVRIAPPPLGGFPGQKPVVTWVTWRGRKVTYQGGGGRVWPLTW